MREDEGRGEVETTGGAMSPVSDWELVGRLILVAALGSFIGLARDLGGRRRASTHLPSSPSGGGAASAPISAKSFPGGDTGRVAARMVKGFGFLGADTVPKREEVRIEGLTTDAGTWVLGSIGWRLRICEE